MNDETNQYIPATGWCYFHFDSTGTGVAIYDVALWKVSPDGRAVGLIPVMIAKGQAAYLTTPPTLGGAYFREGSKDDPRQWPKPPEILNAYPEQFAMTPITTLSPSMQPTPGIEP